ncbi:hypothetical protein OVA24_04660 [Luteolibacter sp. SL250]|uniref:hypothetical protein n=1 Tax=Luteolibacter sp. SL250 TaxID=2995170 RepID=UPI00226E2F48|nr:hypothetical protein [Luteolibacter sp. SL250]WAC20670.1 hypothetical protein OVA24_04660 [Luteolibacter sp. SL250]
MAFAALKGLGSKIGAAALEAYDSACKAAKALFSKNKIPEIPVAACPNACPTALGAGVNELVEKSPTLVANLKALEEDGWVIRYGEPGKGSFCDKTKKEIVIDPNEKDNPASITQTLAHESGHALYSADPYVPHTGLSKDEYVRKNVEAALKDEGEATLMNAKVRDEIMGNGGTDIGIAGAKSDEYEKAYQEYKEHGDREKARKDIGAIFAKGERPSTDPTKTYEEYYGAPYSDYYDQQPAI